MGQPLGESLITQQTVDAIKPVPAVQLVFDSMIASELHQIPDDVDQLTECSANLFCIARILPEISDGFYFRKLFLQ